MSLIRQHQTPATVTHVTSATLQKKWETISEESHDELLQLACKLSATFGLPTAARSQEMRVALVGVLNRCFGYVVEDVENRKPFVKYAMMPFVPKV